MGNRLSIVRVSISFEWDGGGDYRERPVCPPQFTTPGVESFDPRGVDLPGLHAAEILIEKFDASLVVPTQVFGQVGITHHLVRENILRGHFVFFNFSSMALKTNSRRVIPCIAATALARRTRSSGASRRFMDLILGTDRMLHVLRTLVKE